MVTLTFAMRGESKVKKSGHPADVRLAVIGSHAVGKSAISVRFLTKRFIGEYEEDIESTYRREIQFGSEHIDYELRDSAPLYYMRSPIAYVDWATCIAVVYSIDDRASFITASTILEDIHNIIQAPRYLESAPCVGLIANKKDLHHFRQISKTEGKHLGRHYGVGFWEVSAAEDFHSTFGPLNSLIVESYLKLVTARNTTRNISPPMSMKKSSLETSWLPSGTQQRNGHQRNISDETSDYEDVLSIKVPDEDTSKGSTKRRKVSAHELQKKAQKTKEKTERKSGEYIRDRAKLSVGAMVSPIVPDLDSNRKVRGHSSPDLMKANTGEESSLGEGKRNNSLTKKERRRFRKGNDSKPGKLRKSRSYSDINSLEQDEDFASPKQETLKERTFSNPPSFNEADHHLRPKFIPSLSLIPPSPLNQNKHHDSKKERRRSKSRSPSQETEDCDSIGDRRDGDGGTDDDYLLTPPYLKSPSSGSVSSNVEITRAESPIGKWPASECMLDLSKSASSESGFSSLPAGSELRSTTVGVSLSVPIAVPLKNATLVHSTSVPGTSILDNGEIDLAAIAIPIGIKSAATKSSSSIGTGEEKKSKWRKLRKDKQRIIALGKDEKEENYDDVKTMTDSDKQCPSNMLEKTDPRRYAIRRKLSSIFRPIKGDY